MNSNHVLKPYFNKKYPMISHGKGIYLYDKDGSEYIDGTSGAVLCSLGHGSKVMANALKEQAEKIAFAYRWTCVTEPLIQSSERLCNLSNNDFSKVFFVSGGSEATEIAIKLARKYHLNKGNTKKYKIISRWQSYHGSTMGVLSLTGHTLRRKGYEPYLEDQGHIAPGYCYRCWFNKEPQTCQLQCAQALENEIQCQGAENVAAFIMEPLTGMAICGAYPREDYYKKIREICDRYDVLLIFDEVMTGIGRTGKYYAYQHFGCKPDIIALGKALAGGYFPIGATLCNDKIYSLLEQTEAQFPPGYSWAGNPLGCAVALKTLEYLEEHNLVNKVEEDGDYLKASLLDMAERHPTVGDVRGLGFMIGLEFVKDKETREAFELDTKEGYAVQLCNEALKRKMFLGIGYGNNKGVSGDMAMIAPPYIIEKNEIDHLIDILDQSISAVEKKYGY